MGGCVNALVREMREGEGTAIAEMGEWHAIKIKQEQGELD